MSEWSKTKIVDKVYTNMEQNGGDRVAAVELFVTKLSSKAKIAIMNELGVFFVLSLEQDHLRKEHPSYPKPVNFGRNLKAEAAAIAGMMVAVGNTGVRMALGQLTAEDCLTVAGYHNQLAEASRVKGSGWTDVAAQLSGKKTVAESWEKLTPAGRTASKTH